MILRSENGGQGWEVVFQMEDFIPNEWYLSGPQIPADIYILNSSTVIVLGFGSDVLKTTLMVR